MTRTFKTNLRCQACEAKIKPVFDADPSVENWRVNLQSPDKLLTVEGPSVDPRHVESLLESVGYQNLGEVAAPTVEPPPPEEKPASYYPLILIVAYIVGVVGVIEWSFGRFDGGRAMMNFMAGFFLVFSFFKLLDVRAFADSYSTYDLAAMRSRTYALAYPFIELGLGVAYLLRWVPTFTNVVTLVLMLFGSLGVAKSLLARRKIQCACLGSVFNLPMSTVTLVEDLSMAAMAAAMLING
jgi:cation transport ATPase